MKYFTKQWYWDKEARREASINSKELADFVKETRVGEVLREVIEDGRNIDEEPSSLYKAYMENAPEYAIKLQEYVKKVHAEDKVPENYRNYYEQIRPSLPEVIKNIGDYDSMHDYVIIDTCFVGDDLFIIFEDNGVRSYGDQFSSVDPASYEDDYFFISKLIFTNATVLKNELALQSEIHAGWLAFTEVYINEDSYELHILAEVSAPGPLYYDLAELIITFKDIIIEAEER